MKTKLTHIENKHTLKEKEHKKVLDCKEREYNKQLKTLTDTLQSKYNTEISAQNHKIKSLNEKIRTLEITNKQDIDKYLNNIKELKNQHRIYEMDISVLQQKIIDDSSLNSTKLLEASKKYDELRKTLQKDKGQLILQHEETLTMLNTKLLEITGKYNTIEVKLKNSQNTNEDLRQDIKELNEKYTKQNETINTLKITNTKISESNKTIYDENEKLKIKLEKIDSESRIKDSNIQALREELSVISQNYSVQKQKTNVETNQKIDSQKHTKILEEEIEKLITENIKLDEENKNLKVLFSK